MLKNFIYAILFASILLCINSQTQKTNFSKVYDSDFTYQGFKNGTMISKSNTHEYLRLRPISLRIFGRTGNETKELTQYGRNFSANPWLISDGNMISREISMMMSESNGSVEMQLLNSWDYPDNRTTPYQNIDYEYVFEYQSLSPYSKTRFDAAQFTAMSGIDFISLANSKNAVLKDNQFVIREKEFKILHQIPHFTGSGDNTPQTLKSSDFILNWFSYGGCAQITQKESAVAPETMKFKLMSAYSLNVNNEVAGEDLRLVQSNAKTDVDANIAKTDESSEVKFNTFVFGDKTLKTNITQYVSNFKEDVMVYNFTNQESLRDVNAFYNLGEGQNIINKGDFMITYDIQNRLLPGDTRKEFGESKYFEMPIKVQFADNRKMSKFYYYVNFEGQPDDKKVESVLLNDKAEGTGNPLVENFIKIRTTAFKGNAKIQILFKFFDSNKVDTFEKDENEKMVFKHMGGEFRFVNNSWNNEHESVLDDNTFKTLRFDWVKEMNGQSQARSVDTKREYFNVLESASHSYKVMKSKILRKGDHALLINVQTFQNNSTEITHTVQKNKTQKVTFEKGEIYVKYSLLNWEVCKNTTAGCNGINTNDINTQFYLSEDIAEFDDTKKPENGTETKNKTDIYIEVTPLDGSNKPEDFTIQAIEGLEDFSEKFVKINFNLAYMQQNQFEAPVGAFKVAYKTKKPTPSEGGNNMILIIIIIVVCVLLTGLIGYFLYSRAARRKASESRILQNEAEHV